MTKSFLRNDPRISFTEFTDLLSKKYGLEALPQKLKRRSKNRSLRSPLPFSIQDPRLKQVNFQFATVCMEILHGHFSKVAKGPSFPCKCKKPGGDSGCKISFEVTRAYKEITVAWIPLSSFKYESPAGWEFWPGGGIDTFEKWLYDMWYAYSNLIGQDGSIAHHEYLPTEWTLQDLDPNSPFFGNQIPIEDLTHFMSWLYDADYLSTTPTWSGEYRVFLGMSHWWVGGKGATGDGVIMLKDEFGKNSIKDGKTWNAEKHSGGRGWMGGLQSVSSGDADCPCYIDFLLKRIKIAAGTGAERIDKPWKITKENPSIKIKFHDVGCEGSCDITPNCKVPCEEPCEKLFQGCLDKLYKYIAENDIDKNKKCKFESPEVKMYSAEEG